MEGIEGKVALSQTQVPIKTLLVYTKKDDILDFLGLPTYRVLEQAITDQNGKFTLSSLKKMIVEDPASSEKLRNSSIFNRLYLLYIEKFKDNYSDKGLQKKSDLKMGSKLMKQAKNKYVGCLATKIQPDIYGSCLDEYNDPKAKYEQYKIIPFHALKEHQYETELSNKN